MYKRQVPDGGNGEHRRYPNPLNFVVGESSKYVAATHYILHQYRYSSFVPRIVTTRLVTTCCCSSINHTGMYQVRINITGVHNNQDLIWCVKMGVYMGFWDHRGS